MNEKEQLTMMQVKCPYCGYRMPVFYEDDAMSKDVHIVCKGRNCRKLFEIRITEGKQEVR